MPSGERQSTRFSRPRATQALPSARTPKKSLGAKTVAASCTCSPNLASPNSGAARWATVSTFPSASSIRRTGMLSGRVVDPGLGAEHGLVVDLVPVPDRIVHQHRGGAGDRRERQDPERLALAIPQRGAQRGEIHQRHGVSGEPCHPAGELVLGRAGVLR